MTPSDGLPPARRDGRLVISFDDETEAAPPARAGSAEAAALPPLFAPRPDPAPQPLPTLWAGHAERPAGAPVPTALDPSPRVDGQFLPAPTALNPDAMRYVAPGPAALQGAPAYAGWWARVGAAVLDGVISTAVVVLLSTIVGAGIGAEEGLIAGLLTYVILSIVWALAYAPITMSRSGAANGQTLGKQLLAIRVQRVDGQPMTAGTALVREVLFKQFLIGGVGSLLLFVPVVLNALWPLFDERNRAWHDMGAETIVTRA